MNYQEFLEYKKSVILKNPQIVNLAENNLYTYFEVPAYSTPEKTVYRCHMVEDYLKHLALPDGLKAHVGASQGVRASLSILFKELKDWTVPKDVYPFYIQEISKTISTFLTYSTLSNNALFSNVQNGTLLVTYPLKPNSRQYSLDEVNNLKNFLSKSASNLIVIDMVYWLNNFIPVEIMKLYETNQVIILHSLSKTFLLPNHFGISLLPQNSLGQALREAFKTLPKDQAKLDQAYQAMHTNHQLTYKIKQKILENTSKVENILKEKLEQNVENPIYLFYRTESPQFFLDRNILVIPESVFGGSGNGSVVSILV